MADESSARIVHVIGRVQGVSYRAWAAGEARRLELSGWIRNEADGSVSALLVGPQTAIDAMIARMLQGPSLARVERIETDAHEGERPVGFRIVG